MRSPLTLAAAVALLLPATAWAQQQGGQPAPEATPRMEQEREKEAVLERRTPAEMTADRQTGAQQQQQRQAQTGQQAQGQRVPGQRGQAEGADVTVRQPEPDVTVRQPAPDIAIQQARPEVQLRQEEAQVELRQSEPQVEVQPPQQPAQARVERAQPNVHIRQAQPVVNIDQQEPEVIVEAAQEEPRITIEKMRRDEVQLRDAGIQQHQDLIGMDVVDRDDNDVGELRDLIVEGQSIRTGIVNRQGGLFGGDRQVAVPWDRFEVDAENNRLRVRLSDRQVNDLPEFQYDEQNRQQALVGPEEQ